MITRLEINGIDVPIVEDIKISTTYSLADIREPDKRNTAFTKTISLLGTSAINTLFENIFEVNSVTNSYNPNKKVPSAYYVNDVRQLRGDIHLLKIKKSPDNSITYELSMTGDEGSLLLDIGDKYLTDLDLSELDHVYNKANIKNSWDTSYTLNGIATPFSFGDGYTYPFINYGYTASNRVFDVEYLKPAIFARTYMRKIFEQAGYTWQPNGFFDSAVFKRLIIPCNREKIALPPLSIENAAIYAAFDPQGYSGSNSGNLVPISGGIPNDGYTLPFVINFDHKPNIDSGGGGYLTDPSSQYNTSTGITTILSTGYYDIEANVSLKFSMLVPGFPVSYYYSNVDAQVSIEQSTDGGLSWAAISIKVESNTNTNIPGTFYAKCNCQTGSTRITAGSQIRVKCKWSVFPFTVIGATNQAYTVSYFQEVYDGGSPLLNDYRATEYNYICMNKTNSSVSDGDVLLMNNSLPLNIKQRDVLKSFIQMFNLNIEVDRFNKKVIHVETKEDFYDGSIVDWTKKLDYSENIEIIPMGDLNALSYLWKYKQDKDYYNNDYDVKYADNFGLKRFNVDNDFVSNENKTELIFSPTPLVGSADTRIICPVICAKDGTTIKPADHNIRILYYGGLMPGDWEFTDTSGSDYLTMYPYAGNVDNPENPNFDLSFGYVQQVYYNYLGASLTPRNLFRLFYEKAINEITDRDSKILRAYIRLNEVDINTLSFRPDYFIENQYYRLNNIFDYDQRADGSYLCEFIKIKKYALPPPSPPIPPGQGVPIGNNPAYNRNISPNNEGLGRSIRIGGTGNLATGNDIVIDDTSSNVTLINCQRVAAVGLNNFIGIGLTDMVLDSSYEGKTIVGNEIQELKPRYANLFMIK